MTKRRSWRTKGDYPRCDRCDEELGEIIVWQKWLLRDPLDLPEDFFWHDRILISSHVWLRFCSEWCASALERAVRECAGEGLLDAVR
jgi:hypothetical protein